MPAGVLVQTSSRWQSSAVAAAIRIENPTVSQKELAVYRRSPSSSRAPKHWATGMANPLHTPMQKPSTKKFSEPVEPTAARASGPSNWPTITLSTRL